MEENKTKPIEPAEEPKKEDLTIKATPTIDGKEVATKDPEKIEVSKSLLEGLTKKIEDIEKKNEFLESISDERRKALYYARHKKELPVYVKLRTWTTDSGEKVIIGWRTIRDEGAFKDLNTGRWVEKQDIEIILEDGKKIELPLMEWNLRYGHVECKQIGEETDEKGNVSLKLKRLDNNEEYIVGVQFVN